LNAGKVARFLATGMLNTAFGYGVYAGLVLAGLPYLPALVVATVLGVVFNYFSFGKLAFRVATDAAGMPRFVAAYGMALAFNAALLWAAHNALGLGPLVAQLVCLPPTVAVTYLLLDRWAYAKARRHGE
jgi:putative flippase GtrA